jgi:hypothetical protein
MPESELAAYHEEIEKATKMSGIFVHFHGFAESSPGRLIGVLE